jgi:hypothetical protein
MSNEIEVTDTPRLQNDLTSGQQTLQEELDRIANRAAKRAAERQQRYDGEHGIFTK